MVKKLLHAHQSLLELWVQSRVDYLSSVIGDSHDGQIFDGHGHVQDNPSQS